MLFLVLPIARIATGADTVPPIIQMPGTQPQDIANLESPDKCDNCHGGYNSAVEPAHNWRGSMMAQAGRDPIFWATMAIAEQDLDGSGDLCLRCHSTSGWLAGRSTPTDGSGLAAGDADGVECDYCHKLTNPDNQEHAGVMVEPFVANRDAEAYYGSGMSSMWGGSDKLGPYNDADARHQFMRSSFHRDPNFCGTCHDVSNPAVGNVAPNRGTLGDGTSVTADGALDGAVDTKAAFNNPPYTYGIVERTFSEHMSSAIPDILVDHFPGSELPQGGAFEAIYLATTDQGLRSANYTSPMQDRTYTCQTCHMRAVTGTGANKRGVPVRHDLPLHDMTGGNYWMAEAIIWLDSQGKLRLGGGLNADQVDAMRDAAGRAREQLQLAATMKVEGNELEIVNHTGHKLITGYPEGRRMWLNIKWYDGAGTLLREDGAYGPISTTTKGGVAPRSILDLEDPNLFIFEAHMGMDSEWAALLEGLPHLEPSLPLAFDRISGDPSLTLGELANEAGGITHAPTFHFALNNIVEHDNRIPPFGMDYLEASRRNATPVPDYQYRDSASDPTYDHYAEINLEPPSGAVSASIDLLYQPTSWEYIQFLYLANDRSNAFLADEGENMLDAWIATGMAEPFVMTSTTWGGTPPEPPCQAEAPALTDATATPNSITLSWQAVSGAGSYYVYYDQSDKSQFIAEVPCSGEQRCNYTDTGLTSEQSYCYKVTAEVDSCESGFSNVICATTQQPGQTSLATVSSITTGSVIRSGKGKNATEEFVAATSFDAGASIIIRMLIEDEAGSPATGASVDLSVTGPLGSNLVSAASGPDGVTEISWDTEAPNRKGNGGTPAGSYTITVTGLNSATHEWDGSAASIDFTLQ